MRQQHLQHQSQYQDLRLGDLLRGIWQAKLFLLVGLVVGILCSAGFLWVSVPHYQAGMMIGPAQVMAVNQVMQDRDDDRVSMNPAEQKFIQFQVIYKGVSVASLLLRDPRIVEGLRDDRAFMYGKGQQEWNARELSDYIARRVWFDDFGETVLKSLNYQHSDPIFAAYFLQQIHRVSDQIIRADMRKSVDGRIVYLERESAKVMNPEHRRIMTDLLMEQERARMVVLMDEPVAANIIEGAAVNARPVWPNGYLVLGGFSVLGLMMGYLAFGVMQGREVRRYLSFKHRKAISYTKWFKDDSSNNNVNYDEKRRSILRDIVGVKPNDFEQGSG